MIKSVVMPNPAHYDPLNVIEQRWSEVLQPADKIWSWPQEIRLDFELQTKRTESSCSALIPLIRAPKRSYVTTSYGCHGRSARRTPFTFLVLGLWENSASTASTSELLGTQRPGYKTPADAHHPSSVFEWDSDNSVNSVGQCWAVFGVCWVLLHG